MATELSAGAAAIAPDAPDSAADEGSGEISTPESGGEATDAGGNESLGFDERFRQDPDWAMKTFKKVQADYTRDRQMLKEAEQVIQLAKELGSGDLRSGADSVRQFLVQHNSLLSNPKMAKLVNEYLQGGNVPDSFGNEVPEDDPYEDPRDKELKELRQTIAQQSATLAKIEGKTAEREIQQHLTKFFSEFPGMEEEEKAAVLNGLAGNLSQWQKTAQGRQLLQNLDYETVHTLALKHMGPKLLDIAGRAARMKEEAKQSRATDVGGGVRSSGNEATSGTDPMAAIRRFAEGVGINLDKPLTNQ